MFDMEHYKYFTGKHQIPGFVGSSLINDLLFA